MTNLQHAHPQHEVVVAGAGPVGLLLAAELAQAGVDVAVLERRTGPDTTIKAGSITGAAVGTLDRRGLLDAALEAQARALASFARSPGRPPSGPRVAGHFAAFPLRLDLIDRDDDAVDHGPAPFALAIPQAELETILDAHARALGVTVLGGNGVTGVEQDDDGVWVDDEAGRRRRAGWLVGADGGRSSVRRAAGIAFPGTDPEITGRQALVELEGADDVEAGWHHGAGGVYCLGPAPGRVLTVEFGVTPADRDAPVTDDELTGSLRRVTGADVRVTAVHSATRWTDHARLAATYRRGRILLAGDAAHVHAPFGGQGLGLGLTDAVNLGWKLAAVVAGRAGEALLDTYDAERRPPAEAVLELTRAQVALMRPDAKTLALRRLAASVLSTRAGTTGVASLLAGPSAAPVPGSAAPELRLHDGRRLAEVARDGRFTLVGDATVRAVGAGRGQVTTAPAAGGMLVRPDGVVAWAGDDLGALRDALDRWCPDGALSRT